MNARKVCDYFNKIILYISKVVKQDHAPLTPSMTKIELHVKARSKSTINKTALFHNSKHSISMLCKTTQVGENVLGCELI